MFYSGINNKVKYGKDNIFEDHCLIGGPPEHWDYYRNHLRSDKGIIIGDRNIIREFVTVHAPLTTGTRIGNDCFIMAHCHIGHDCNLGNDVIMSDHVSLGGHTTLMDGVYMGMSSVTHPNTTIGAYSIIGCGCSVVKDIPPFVKYVNGKDCFKVNDIGMRRVGFEEYEINAIEQYYHKYPELNISNEVIHKTLNNSILLFRGLTQFVMHRNTDRKIAKLNL